MSYHRRYPVGAETVGGVTHFRVWAPEKKSVRVVFADGREVQLNPESDGYHSGQVQDTPEGAQYKLQLDDRGAFPDPASRYQPEGPHGFSEVVDPHAFQWSDAGWVGPDLYDLAISELHIGTFTEAGTWSAAAEQLSELMRVGINCVEIMPVNDFPGTFGWGYDGVNLFAPTRLYGSPDDFRKFVDRAHSLKMAVILDVVYNHFGPDGNYLAEFSEWYFTDRYKTDWGAAINYDGDHSGPVRDMICANAAYWIDEFHLDGLRLDATQNIYDNHASGKHIIACLAKSARAAAPDRHVLLIAENETQESKLCRAPADGGYGLDAFWNDDFHHSAKVALTGRREAYYKDYAGHPQEFISAAKYGFLYQGQWYSWQKQRRGDPGLDMPASSFINCLENHDQVANSARGWRAWQLASPARYRTLYALMLLMPGTPMLFQGQEFGASSPFLFFADHHKELAPLVQKGRAEFLKQFQSMIDSDALENIALPHSRTTFERCKLDFSERHQNYHLYQLTHDLLKIRHADRVLQPRPERRIDGAVISSEAFVLRYFGQDEGDRLIVVNLGGDLSLESVPEPLLAPVYDGPWQQILSTEDAHYGGDGRADIENDLGGWRIPSNTAWLLTSGPRIPDDQSGTTEV